MVYLFAKTKELKTPANIFVINLALSDLCLMLSQFPMFIYNTFSGGIWMFGPFMCELYAAAGSVFSLCSICTMTIISIDRYNVIVRGIKAFRMSWGKFKRSNFDFRKGKVHS